MASTVQSREYTVISVCKSCYIYYESCCRLGSMKIPTECEEEISMSEVYWGVLLESYHGKEGSRTRPREELTSETVSIEALDNTVRSFEVGLIF